MQVKMIRVSGEDLNFVIVEIYEKRAGKRDHNGKMNYLNPSKFLEAAAIPGFSSKSLSKFPSKAIKSSWVIILCTVSMMPSEFLGMKNV